MFLSLALLGCSNDYLVVDSFEEEELIDPTWDSAELVVVNPASGDFLPWEEDNEFEAMVVDAEGNPLEFDAITWSSDVDAEWSLLGAQVADDALGVGTHALTAEAVLPNGDRLRYTVGGVLVQSAYAGTYTGSLRVDLITDQFSTACSGAAQLVIDPYGELVQGDANCFLSLQGFDLDGAYLLDLENDDGDLDGAIAVDLFGFELPMDFSGDVSEDGELEGEFSGDALGFAQFEGLLTATRLSRDTNLF